MDLSVVALLNGRVITHANSSQESVTTTDENEAQERIIKKAEREHRRIPYRLPPIFRCMAVLHGIKMDCK